MTNAELIKALRCGTVKGDGKLNCSSCNYSHGDCCWTMIMLDAADALEALLKERAEMIEGAKKTAKVYAKFYEKYNELESRLPKEGEWIAEPMTREKFYNDPYLSAKCSICGANSRERGHYCPNCGARMRGEHDE